MKQKLVTSFDAQVGARVRLCRRMANVSQAALSSAIGVSFQQVQKYENGTNRISASRIQQIATVLGVVPEFFFGNVTVEAGKPDEPGNFAAADEIGVFLISKDGLALNRAFLQIADAEVRRSIVALVKALGRQSD